MLQPAWLDPGQAVIQQALQARADSNHQGIHQHPPTDAQLLERDRQGLPGLAARRRPFSTWQSLLALGMAA